MYQITSTYFCVGLVIDNDRVIKAGPIINYMIGWSFDKVHNTCVKRCWTIEKI